MSERRQHGVPGPRERAGVADAERKEGYTPHEQRGLGPHHAQDLSGARSCVCACVCVRASLGMCARTRARWGKRGFYFGIVFFEVAAACLQGARREVWRSEQVHGPLKVVWVSVDHREGRVVASCKAGEFMGGVRGCPVNESGD